MPQLFFLEPIPATPPLFRPPRFPAPLEPSPPLDPASMPIPPPPVPPLAAKNEERRPWPPMKKKMPCPAPRPPLFRPPRPPLLAPKKKMPCPPPPPLLRPPRPFPTPLEPSLPLDPASTPPPPLAAEDGVKKARLLPLPYAVSRVERACGMAMIGLHIVICVVMLLDFAMVPHEPRFWIWLCLYLCFSAMVVITCVDICYDDPSPQQKLPQAAALQLPPPPPEMDMC